MSYLPFTALAGLVGLTLASAPCPTYGQAGAAPAQSATPPPAQRLGSQRPPIGPPSPPAASPPLHTPDHVPVAHVTPGHEMPIDGRHVVDLAICLDTSGSMSELIEAAKQKLWAIVNDLALAEPTPRIRVALLTFGNDGHEEARGWVRIDQPLTEDLDIVSQRLFELGTNGGTELVGRVVNDAATQLDWHPSADALKLIVVAGNESADQDTVVSFRDAARTAIQRGVMVNSIYCGDPADGLAPAWQEVAQLADGQFAAIDKDHGTIIVETPFDAELTELSASVNGTYIPIGADGQQAWFNQSTQDANASSLNSAAAASRAQTKGCAAYTCSWDLIDACKNGSMKIEEVAVEDLPEAMQSMTPEERAAHVAAMATRRAEIQAEINQVNVQRRVYIENEMRTQGLDESKAFDAVIRRAVREQATVKGFRFPEIEKTTTEQADGANEGA